MRLCGQMTSNELKTSVFFQQSRPSSALLWLAALAGFVLSLMSILGICTDACGETAKYAIFGLDFSWFGLVFFLALLMTVAVRHRFAGAWLLLTALLFSAAGAELYFIWLQKYVIGTWCPICLSIAAAVCLGALVLLYELIRRKTMKNNLKNAAVMVAALVVGLVSAIVGVAKESQAAPDYFLGNTKSQVTVYFVSDWFCPACRQLEPRVEQIHSVLAKDVRLAYVDFPIHAETNNFTPYNLQFLAFEKKKYLALRAALTEVSKKTKTPTPEQIQAAVAPLGVKLRQMNYADILYGLQANLTTYRGFDVKATPSVVVANAKTRKHKLFVGDRQITLPAIQAAIQEISK